MSKFYLRKNEAIVVFAYDFPHRKTSEFLKEIKISGFSNVIVIGAPKLLLDSDPNSYFEPFIVESITSNTQSICEQLSYQFYSINHEDVDLIEKLVKKCRVQLAIISGARILKKQVIDLFEHGIINFHPGKIPETSGLDSFFYTIKHFIKPGVSAHLIDARVDAGRLWRFGEIALGLEDTPSTVSEKIFWKQITMLKEFLQTAITLGIETTIIDRPMKNNPMLPIEKYRQLHLFKNWLAHNYAIQKLEKLYRACTENNISVIKSDPSLLPLINKKILGEWTPLIVASFNHSTDVIVWLLENGANPSYATAKGTTVLMYAKTKYLGLKNKSYPILDLLIRNGADIDARDSHGKNVVEYCIEQGDNRLADYLQSQLLYGGCNP